jgi:glycosyltransferase involved in cell wall biosynthesis
MSCAVSDLSTVAISATGARRPVKLMKFVTNFATGGTERQFVNLGLGLEPSRFAVHFGCLRHWGEHLEAIQGRGISVFDYNLSTFKHPRAMAAQYRLARDIRRHGIEIVHSYNFYANVFAIPAARLAGAHVVASIRDMGIYLSARQRHLQRYICRFADQILVNATAIKNWLVTEGYDGSRITVIPNGIDLSRFEQVSHGGGLHGELNLPVSAPLVGVVGRVARLKGIEDFLQAAVTVARRFPAARFLVVGGTFTGDESFQLELMDLAERLGVVKSVTFTGFRSDVERILPDLSVSVLPSLSEGLSNALLESMAAGVPVVATRVGDSAEAVRDGENGLLVPPANPDSLAEAICRLLGDPALSARLGEAARRSVAERFSMLRMIETTSTFYDSLLART